MTMDRSMRPARKKTSASWRAGSRPVVLAASSIGGAGPQPGHLCKGGGPQCSMENSGDTYAGAAESGGVIASILNARLKRFVNGCILRTNFNDCRGLSDLHLIFQSKRRGATGVRVSGMRRCRIGHQRRPRNLLRRPWRP
jgi:hypothetical protein